MLQQTRAAIIRESGDTVTTFADDLAGANPVHGFVILVGGDDVRPRDQATTTDASRQRLKFVPHVDGGAVPKRAQLVNVAGNRFRVENVNSVRKGGEFSHALIDVAR